MDIYDQINQVIDQIEQGITEPLSIDSLANQAHLNKSTLQMIFPLLTGVGLKEYIRKRRLTLAVSDLKNGQKVIDVALKYQYESPNSFTRAFHSFHGIKPSSVKNKEAYFNQFPRLFLEKTEAKKEKQFRIVRKKAFHFYCVHTEIEKENLPKQISDYWAKIKKEYPIFLKEEKRYGFLENHHQQYYCGLTVPFAKAEEIVFPTMDYFVLNLSSPQAEEISKRIIKAQKKDIADTNLKSNHFLELEVYHKANVELWISIS